MDLFDRYAQALRVFLSKGQQDDIIHELSEDVRSEADAREADLGRPLNEAEQAELLKHYGHPMLVASRYRPSRYLIGPVIFPFYWLMLRLGIALAVVVQVIGILALLAGGASSLHEIVQPVRALAGALLRLCGWMTLMFAGLEIYFRRAGFFEDWDPRALPPLIQHGPRLGRSESVAQFAIAVVLSAWYLAGLKLPYLLLGPATSTLDLAPVWRHLYVPILLLALANLARQYVTLVRPQWTRLLLCVRIATTSASFAVLYLLLMAGEWVVAVTANDAHLERSLDLVNHAIFLALIVAGIAIAAEAVLNIRGLVLARVSGRRE